MFRLSLLFFVLLTTSFVNAQHPRYVKVVAPGNIDFENEECWVSIHDEDEEIEWYFQRFPSKHEVHTQHQVFEYEISADVGDRSIQVACQVQVDKTRREFSYYIVHINEAVDVTADSTIIYLQDIDSNRLRSGRIDSVRRVVLDRPEPEFILPPPSTTLVVKGPELPNQEDYACYVTVNRTKEEEYRYHRWQGSDQNKSIPIEKDHQELIWTELDSTVRIEYSIRNRFLGEYYRPLDTVLVLQQNDTNRFIIESPSEHLIDLVFKERVKTMKKARRKSSFLTFFEDWSHVLYVSYYQGHESFGELLYGPSRYVETPERLFSRHEVPGAVWGPAFGAEFNFRWNEKFIIGPKVGAQVSSRLLNAGVHLVYYTDTKDGVFFLKPRLGINFLCPFLNLSYAYGIRLGKNPLGIRVNQHQLCLNVIIPLYLTEY